MKKIPISAHPQWKDYVTPKLLRQAPIHRWLVFPHSFSGELVKELSEKWGLDEHDVILDPFLGAGTTLVTSKEIGISATGFDISPYSIFITNVKTQNYNLNRLEQNWGKIKDNLHLTKRKPKKTYPDLVEKALSPKILSSFEEIDKIISLYSSSSKEQSFFRLALFKIIPEFSKAKASGGWLKWTDIQNTRHEILSKYDVQVNIMMEDLKSTQLNKKTNIQTQLCDARFLPSSKKKFTAVITSPPYPNRHDYTRIFGVELMYGFLDWEGTRTLRYQSIHSHPESKPVRPKHKNYVTPKDLCKTIKVIKNENSDNRVIAMLEGYFVDLYCCFKEIAKVCAKKAPIAIVLGNAQYYGEPVCVDEIAANIGEQVGLICTDILAARLRGNSAQQMKLYGRHPSRESVIIFRNG